MWFGVLGRLEVRRGDGTAVSIGGRARRRVLAALLSRPGSLLTADTLIDDLWGSTAPRSAVGSLRSHVARLRDDLGRDEVLLLTEGDGCRLCVGTDDLDAAAFEHLSCEAGRLNDAAAALARYDAALGLWRDEAYLEFGDAPFAVAERVRLAELRSLARERRTDLALQLGMSGDLVAELEQRVRTEPYRERGWEQLALALYRGGRQGDALGACRRGRRVLLDELGVDPGPGLADVEGRILRQDPDLVAVIRPQVVGVAALRDRCPYLGLAGYEEQDAPLFVGRERLTSMVAGQLAERSVVVLVGASGVGKSSLVRAGLIPALRAGALPGSASWRIDMRTPLAAPGFDDVARRPDLLVLDQAEELFTGFGRTARDQFISRLADYVRYGDGSLLVVLRSDFYGRLAEAEPLGQLAEKTGVLVGPMRADELRRALVEPASAAGLRLEPELVETVMEDVAGQPEPLPLLSEAMVRTWRRRDGDLLTLAGYRRAGAVAGALEAAAEECYLRLDEATRQAARHVLVRMAAPSGAGGWARRPLVRAEISRGGSEQQALDALVTARLAVVTDLHVELAHDAVLEHWPRLRGWLDERALAAELVEHLGRAATAWRTSGRQESDLYRGPRLSSALDWRTEHPADLSPDEEEFLDESTRAAQAELEAARAQATREARGRSRLRLVALALAAVVVLALAGGTVALLERSIAQHQARHARQAALTADVNRLATVAGTLPGRQRDQALLLAAEAYELEGSDQAAGGLEAALMNTPPGLDRVIRYRSTSRQPHLDHSGWLLAVPGDDGTVTVLDLRTGGTLKTLMAPTGRQFAVFSGDDRFVAAGGSDGTVVIWNVRTGRRVGAPLPVGGRVVRPVFDPRDDDRLYVLAGTGALTIWDRRDPAHPRQVGVFEGIVSSGDGYVTITRDGRRIAAGDLQPQTGGSGAARIWDTRSRARLDEYPGSIGVLADDDVTLPLGYSGDTVLLDVSTKRIEATVRGTGGASLAVLDRRGRRIAVSEKLGGRSAVAVYDLHSHQRVGQPLRLHGNIAYPLGFLPDGRLVTSGTNEAAIWTPGRPLPPIGVRLDTSADRAASPDNTNEAPIFLPGSRTVLVLGGTEVPTVHDAVTGRLIGTFLGGLAEGRVAGSPDGRLVVGELHDTGVGVGIWDIRNGRRIASLPGVSAGLWLAAPLWSAAGDRIAIDIGGAVFVWQVNDPRHPSGPVHLEPPGSAVTDAITFTPDGRRLVAISAGSTRISLIDIATKHVVWTRPVEDGTARQAAVSPDAATIAYDSGGTGSGEVTLLDTASGRRTATIPVPSYGGIGYVNRGRWLVATSNQPEPAAQLYDARTLQPIGVPMPTGDVDEHPVTVDSVGSRFAQDLAGDFNFPTSSDPFVWNADPAEWVRIACGIAGRNLTASEWRQYLPDRRYLRTCPEWPAGA
jgi:DNA-binding SARP family transcriptional activator/WD40 repeat protein